MTVRQHMVEFSAKYWLYSGKSAWYFLTLPTDIATEISYFSKALYGRKRMGWGSVKVTAQIGNTVWQTSLFPDSKSKSYLLPLKAAVRKSENIIDGKPVNVRLSTPMP